VAHENGIAPLERDANGGRLEDRFRALATSPSEREDPIGKSQPAENQTRHSVMANCSPEPPGSSRPVLVWAA
jgi:hypothetical protein